MTSIIYSPLKSQSHNFSNFQPWFCSSTFHYQGSGGTTWKWFYHVRHIYMVIKTPWMLKSVYYLRFLWTEHDSRTILKEEEQEQQKEHTAIKNSCDIEFLYNYCHSQTDKQTLPDTLRQTCRIFTYTQRHTYETHRTLTHSQTLIGHSKTLIDTHIYS